MVAAQLPHNPATDSILQASMPSINQLLSAAGAETDPTLFLPGAGSARSIALSIAEEGGAPAGGFALDMMRSIDGGFSWQVYKTFTAQAEPVEDNVIANDLLWKFVLRTKGARNIRVRVRCGL